MKQSKIWITAAALALLTGQAAAQQSVDREREMEQREVEYAERLRAAEKRMEEAARQVAELSVERLPEIRDVQMRIASMNKPRIGINIDGSEDSGAVDGVVVVGVSPGSAADDAGLRAGDVITSVNGEDMAADSSAAANKRLFNFMDGVEEGDELDIDYLRNGKGASVELSPRKTAPYAFAWAPEDRDVFVQRFVGPHKDGQVRAFSFDFPWASGWGSMELVELNEGLGRYFGTDDGLLVVSAPEPESYGLQDGDVIQSIDGREPKDVRHALKILGSYDSGEQLELGIMRDKRKRKIDVEIPANDFRGSLFNAPAAPTPATAPQPPLPTRDAEST